MAAARRQKQLNECLIWAAEKNEVDKLKYYLDEGANVDKSDVYRRTSLIKATQNANITAFECLIAHGANIHKEDVEGETALLHASYNGCFDILCRLVELGADVNHGNKNEESSVYIASKYAHYDCVRRLVMVGGDYSKKSKFGKTAVDVAIDSMHKARRRKQEETCHQLEKIIELLSDANEIENLRKQEKMFTLTPEEFRLCLERSQYRPSDVNVRVIGLNDHSTQAVTRALIGQLNLVEDEITNGITFYNGYCDLNLETGDWMTHNKMTERDIIYRNMGEVVRHYVNNYNFETEERFENQLKRNKFSHLFRSNTVYCPETDTGRNFLRENPNTLIERETLPKTLSRSNTSCSLYSLKGDFSPEIERSLSRAKTSTSLYSLKKEQSAISLSGMNFSLAEDTEDTSSECSMQPVQQIESEKTFKNIAKKFVQSVKHKVDSLIHTNRTTNHGIDLVTNRKQVYDTFECVKSAMQTNNDMLASLSLCSMSADYDFVNVHKLLFNSSAIHIFVIDSDVDFKEPCPLLVHKSGRIFSNKEYIQYLVHSILRRNDGISKDHSVVIFLILDTGKIKHEQSSNAQDKIFSELEAMYHGNECGKFVIIDSTLNFSFEDLYSEKKRCLTKLIYEKANELIQNRRSRQAIWLALQEMVVIAKEVHGEILKLETFQEICVHDNYSHIVTFNSTDIEKFIHFQTSTGRLLRLNPDGENFVCLDISVLYHLFCFLNHVAIKLVHDQNDSTSLYERLKTVVDKTMDKSMTKCYISITDTWLLVSRYLNFVATNSKRFGHEHESVQFLKQIRVVDDAPESINIQFQRYEYSACFGFALKFEVSIVSVFRSLICAFFEIMPLKQLHSKDVIFRNCVVFCVDIHHNLCITLTDNTIIFCVTRNISDNSSAFYWHSKSDICSGIFELAKYFFSKILNGFESKGKNKATEYTIVLDTCALSPPCMENVETIAVQDTYKCSKHDCFVDPKEVLNIWNISKVGSMFLVEECTQTCKGPSGQFLSETATDADFARIIRRVSVRTRTQLLLVLRNELRMTLSEGASGDIDQLLLHTLIRWRNSARQPKMDDLQKALSNSGDTKHVLCKINRPQRVTPANLHYNPKAVIHWSPKLLTQLSVRLLSRSLYLSLELGLDFVEYNDIVKKHRENLQQTTSDILLLCEHKTLNEVIEIFMEIGLEGENLNEIISMINSI